MAFSAFTGFDHTSALAALGRGVQDARKTAREEEQRRTLANLGQGIDGTPEGYGRAAQALLGLGDTAGATNFLALGEKARERTLDEAARKSSPFAIQPSGGASAAPSIEGGPRASLIQNESGGNWQAQNDATGAGGMKGHFGRLQFGQARLQEAQAAGAIPPGTTPQTFMASPELQKRAESWHFNDIDTFIKSNGLDRAVGGQINGVPVTIDGMRAVAHLGGKEGLAKFIASGGRYNPADANGTRLSDYFARHSGAGGSAPQVAQARPTMPVQVAETEADVQRLEGSAPPLQIAQAPAQPGAPVADIPAQGAAPAGFNVPGSGIPPNDPFPQVTTQQLYGVLNDPRMKNDHAIATQILQNRLRYSDENAPDKREAVRLQNEKTRLDIEKGKRELGGKGFRVLNSQERAEAGVDPSYKGVVQIDREGQLFFPGKASTEVNVGSGEKSFDQTVGKAYGEQFVEIQKGARDASKTLGTIGMMERLIQTPGFYSGLGGERSLAVNRALVSLGIKDPKAATAQEAFQALSNQVVLDAAGGSLGAQISNGDREYINATAPNLANTPEGNKELLSIRRKMAERQQIIGKMARDYAKANGGRLDAGFDEQVSAFAEANPLFKPVAPVAAPGTPAPQNAAPRAVTSPADYEALKPGDTFTDPQGNIRTKR